MTAASARDRPYHHGDLRAALITAGRTILEEGGPRALSFREAARRVGVSHAAPGHHFESLETYLAECAADGFEQFANDLEQAAATAVDALDGLCAMGVAYVEFALAHRAMFRLMFDRDSFGQRTAALRRSGERAYGVLVGAVQRTQPAIADARELDFRVGGVWALVHGYANLALEAHIRGSRPSPAQQASRAVRAFLLGLALPQSPSTRSARSARSALSATSATSVQRSRSGRRPGPTR